MIILLRVGGTKRPGGSPDETSSGWLDDPDRRDDGDLPFTTAVSRFPRVQNLDTGL